jgi:hypothetical protein
MAIHTDTKNLINYTPRTNPTIPGGDVKYLDGELTRVSNALNKAVEVIKLLEARMNTNGLT